MSFEIDRADEVSVRSVQIDMKKNGPFMVISWLEIECYKLTPVNPLKFRFTVLSKLSKKWHFILTLVI